MSRIARGCSLFAVAAPILLIASCVADRAYFASNARQRQILKNYFPEVQCDTADFELLEREDGWTDYLYQVRISKSEICLKSLRSALAKRGYVQGTAAEGVSGLQPPGRAISDEQITFDFDRQPGSVIWTRGRT